MPGAGLVDRWLASSTRPLPPDQLLHPADEFPLATISNPPSSSLDSDDSDSDTQIAARIHPPAPSMDSFHRQRRTPPIMDDFASFQQRQSRSLLSRAIANNERSSNVLRGSQAPNPQHAANSDGTFTATDSDEDSEFSTKSGSDIDVDEGLEDDEETGLTSRQRRRRRKQKRRNARLDERIAGGLTPSGTEEKLAQNTFLSTALINVALILSWYSFSISISVYNKWMFTDKGKDKEMETSLNFPFPLFSTSLHMIVQFGLASAVLYFFPKSRPQYSFGQPSREHELDEPKKPLMTRWFYLTRIGPCGAATGLDIGLGNMSLRFITLTFYTMCKSSVLGFVLLFAFLFRLEKPSWKLGGIITTMTVGVVMMVAGETAFDPLGFVLIMSSACSSGFRWSLTQILLLRHPATSNPFSSLFYLTPVMFVSLLALALPVEGLSHLREGLAGLVEAKGMFLGIAILLFPGTLAFMMTASEFALLKRTSVVTLSVCGIFKEVVTISTASIVFNDRLTPINVSGLVVTICSIAAYNYIKIKKMRSDAKAEAHAIVEEYTPVLSTEPEVDDLAAEADTGRPSSSNPIRNGLAASALVPGELRGTDSLIRSSPSKRPKDME